jgi:hypothetical protein
LFLKVSANKPLIESGPLAFCPQPPLSRQCSNLEMVQFLDLPLEILPIIFENILKPHHLMSICLVNKAFHEFAIPRLYERASIYSWQRESKAKVAPSVSVDFE